MYEPKNISIQLLPPFVWVRNYEMYKCNCIKCEYILLLWSFQVSKRYFFFVQTINCVHVWRKVDAWCSICSMFSDMEHGHTMALSVDLFHSSPKQKHMSIWSLFMRNTPFNHWLTQLSTQSHLIISGDCCRVLHFYSSRDSSSSSQCYCSVVSLCTEPFVINNRLFIA